MKRSDIDKLVAEKVMGWAVIDYKNIGVTVVDDGEFPVEIEDFQPSERIEDAWEVVKQLRRKGIQTEISSDGFTVKMYRWEKDKTPPYRYKRYLAKITDTIKFDDIPEMICRAALEAVGVEVNL